jgi:hypothetical protein
MSGSEMQDADLWQIRDLLHWAERCLDAFEGSALVPPEALTLAKALECASVMVSRQVNLYLAESFERAKHQGNAQT